MVTLYTLCTPVGLTELETHAFYSPWHSLFGVTKCLCYHENHAFPSSPPPLALFFLCCSLESIAEKCLWSESLTSTRMTASLPARASELEGDVQWPSWSSHPRKEAARGSAALQMALSTCEQPYPSFYRPIPWTQMCTVAEIGSVYGRGWAGTGSRAETAFLVMVFFI